jgi:putative FmdB family regulatory protein
MPIYEYHCSTCDNRVEVLIRSSSATPACPDCGSPLTNKLFSAPNILRSRSRRPLDHTCCGQADRCDEPPCSAGGECRRH